MRIRASAPVSASARAQSITELLVGLIALVPVVLILIDMGSLFIASAMNSDICREAARAAANGPPDRLKAGEPQKRAETVVNRKRAMCAGNVTIDSPIAVRETVRDPLPAKPFGGQVDGEVTVETTVVCRPPFLVAAIVPQGVKIKTSQTYPFSWVMTSDDLVSGTFGGGGLSPSGGPAGGPSPSGGPAGSGGGVGPGLGGGSGDSGPILGGGNGGGGIGNASGGLPETTGGATPTTGGELPTGGGQISTGQGQGMN